MVEETDEENGFTTDVRGELFLFRHDYGSVNMLQRLNNLGELVSFFQNLKFLVFRKVKYGYLLVNTFKFVKKLEALNRRILNFILFKIKKNFCYLFRTMAV